MIEIYIKKNNKWIFYDEYPGDKIVKATDDLEDLRKFYPNVKWRLTLRQ